LLLLLLLLLLVLALGLAPVPVLALVLALERTLAGPSRSSCSLSCSSVTDLRLADLRIFGT